MLNAAISGFSILLGGDVTKAGKIGKHVDTIKDAVVKAKKGSAGGPGAGKAFSKKTKDLARSESNNRCVFCGKKTTRKPGPDQSNIDHAIPKSKGETIRSIMHRILVEHVTWRKEQKQLKNLLKRRWSNNAYQKQKCF